MAKQCTDMDDALRLINQRLRKLEKSDSEKTEEIGRLNRIINRKDKEIHSLKAELATTKKELSEAKSRIKELEGGDGDDGPSGGPRKPEKNSSNSSVPPSRESIAAREKRRTRCLRKPSGKPGGGQPGHKGSTLQTVGTPDRIVMHKPHYCKCCGRPLDGIGYRKIRKTQIMDIRFVMETTEDQYCEKVCECGAVNNCDAPNCRIKYGDNIRALVTYLNVVQCIPFKRIAELISDLSGRRISEGTVQNILKKTGAKSDGAYEEIRKRIECAPVVGADETGAAVGRQLHWNWIFQTDALTYVYQMKSRGMEAIDSRFPKGLPNATLVTDRRWTTEVAYHDCKQLLDFGRCRRVHFSAQIASFTLTMMQYNILCTVKRFEASNQVFSLGTVCLACCVNAIRNCSSCTARLTSYIPIKEKANWSLNIFRTRKVFPTRLRP